MLRTNLVHMNYGSRANNIKKIMNLEEELKIIHLHRYKEEELRWMSDQDLADKWYMLDEWQKRQNQNQ